MSFLNRLKLLGGLIVVVLILGLLTVLFNQRQNQVASITAHVEAPRTVIASPYGGLVTKQNHNPGEYVSAGEELFTITSANLKDMASQGTQPNSTEGYKISLEDGTITFFATIAGYLDSFTAVQGSYVNSAESLAEIVSSANKTVVARFQLNPSDYGRIEPNGKVTIHLPNGQLVEGQVMSINIATDSATSNTVTEVTVSSDALQAEDLMLLTRRGTPVTAIMTLRDDGPLAGPTQAVYDFLLKIGLR